MVQITPQSTSLDILKLRESIYKLGDQQVRVLVERDYNIEYASGHTNLDVITFSWNVRILTIDPCDTFFFSLNTEGYEDYTKVTYPTWETLDTLSHIFLITADSIVINNDGSINISETMMNNNIRQY